MSQTERILYIDRSLRTAGSFTVQDIVDKFEISIRQAKRDIEYMRERFEAPVLWNAKLHAYVYGEKFKRLEFADQHLILAYLSMQSMLKNANYFPAVSDELLSSFTSQIPKDYLGVCDRILYQVSAAESLKPEFFACICGALRDKVCLQLVYVNSKNQKSERRVEPYYLINYTGNWYMLCWDYNRNELRTFNIARIEKLSSASEAFEDHGRDFQSKLKSFIENGFGIFMGEKTQTVKIKFTGEAARIVHTQKWHPKQTVEVSDKDGKEIIISFPAADLTEVLSKVLSFGENAVPLEPAELQELWKEKIRKMRELSEKIL